MTSLTSPTQIEFETSAYQSLYLKVNNRSSMHCRLLIRLLSEAIIIRRITSSMVIHIRCNQGCITIVSTVDCGVMMYMIDFCAACFV